MSETMKFHDIQVGDRVRAEYDGKVWEGVVIGMVDNGLNREIIVDAGWTIDPNVACTIRIEGASAEEDDRRQL